MDQDTPWLRPGRLVALVLWVAASLHVIGALIDFVLLSELYQAPYDPYEPRAAQVTWGMIWAQLGTAALYLGLGSVIDLLGLIAGRLGSVPNHVSRSEG